MKFSILITLTILMLSLLSVHAETPAKCLQPHPKGEGPCRMAIMGYYFNPATKKCEQWIEGGCSSSSGNSYFTLEDCNNECLAD